MAYLDNWDDENLSLNRENAHVWQAKAIIESSKASIKSSEATVDIAKANQQTAKETKNLVKVTAVLVTATVILNLINFGLSWYITTDSSLKDRQISELTYLMKNMDQRQDLIEQEVTELKMTHLNR